MDGVQAPKDNVNMAPVKKQQRPLGRTHLREWRKRSNLSQEQAAAELDVSRTLLSKIENAKSPYSQHILEKAADAYGSEVAALITVNPLQEGDVADFISMLKMASPEVRAAIIGYARGRLSRDGQQ